MLAHLLLITLANAIGKFLTVFLGGCMRVGFSWYLGESQWVSFTGIIVNRKPECMFDILTDSGCLFENISGGYIFAL